MDNQIKHMEYIIRKKEQHGIIYARTLTENFISLPSSRWPRFCFFICL